MLIPVIPTSDGILIDGHQRLRLLLRKGRTLIDAADVRIDATATAENALERAITIGAGRRHLTVEEKGAKARQLQKERGWSQGKIAKLFGVQRPAVSQWFAKTAKAGDTAPTHAQSIDGHVRYVPEPEPRPEPKAPRSARLPDGRAFKAIRKARTLISSEPVGGLSALLTAKLQQELQDLIEAAEGMQGDLGEE
jgi:DNA-binding transcriptional regulator YdaS (Cro superfamily)